MVASRCLHKIPVLWSRLKKVGDVGGGGVAVVMMMVMAGARVFRTQKHDARSRRKEQEIEIR